MLRSLILLVVLAACSSTTSESRAPAPPPQAPTGSGTDPTKPLPTDAVACEVDADCNRHACGPCKPGDVLTQQDVTIKCFRNPCPQTTVSCKNKVCTVN